MRLGRSGRRSMVLVERLASDMVIYLDLRTYLRRLRNFHGFERASIQGVWTKGRPRLQALRALKAPESRVYASYRLDDTQLVACSQFITYIEGALCMLETGQCHSFVGFDLLP